MAEVKYIATGVYSPKAPKNIQSYKEVTDCLPATVAEMKEKIPQHTDFVGYLIRRKGLVPEGTEVKAKESKAKPADLVKKVAKPSK